MIDLAAARKICEGATPGPWGRSVGRGKSKDGRGVFWAEGPLCANRDRAIVDMDFIAFARTALPECLEEIEQLRKDSYELIHEHAKSLSSAKCELESLRTENAELRESVRWHELELKGHREDAAAEALGKEIQKFRKRLELAEAVCKAADRAMDSDVIKTAPFAGYSERLLDLGRAIESWTAAGEGEE